MEEYEALENQDGFELGESNTYSKTTTSNVGFNLWIQEEKVSDLHTLNKVAIWMVATASLQKVDRKVETLEARISALETAVANL